MVDTPDVDIFAPPVPPPPAPVLGRFAAAIQVFVCCGQVPTQGLIGVILVLCGMQMMANGQLTLPFFAALSLIDTALVAFMIFVFLRASGESFRGVFFGRDVMKKEILIGLALIPVVLVGTGIILGVLRVAFPGLHNVKVSPYDSFTDTPLHAALFVFVVIVAGGFREELARGFLLHRFEQRLGGIWVGQAIYTVVFAGAHWPQGWDAVIGVGALGFFWGYLYIRRRSSTAAMINHAGFDALQVIGQLAAKMMGLPVPQ